MGGPLGVYGHFHYEDGAFRGAADLNLPSVEGLNCSG